ncbi:MAG: MCE-family protein Mce1B [Acidimicrobiales bacterium]|nr:MCE-family protein Mce1B [Acidimicrobiales bacterium]
MRVLARMRKGLAGKPGRNMLKLLVYSSVCIVVLFGLIGLIGNVDFFAKKHGYRAVLPDATGLLVNDQVKVAGVGVGKVTGIKVERGQALVSFQLRDGVVLREGTRTAVRWRNVLGQKYLYLAPNPTGKVLPAGSKLPVGQADRSADVGEFLNSVGPILRSIDPAKANAFVRALNDTLAGNEDKVRGLLSDTASLSSDLGGMDTQIGRVIGNLDTVVGTLAARDGDLNTAVTRLGTLAKNLAMNNDDLLLLVDRFTRVQDGLNRLVSENRTNIDGTINDLTTIAKVLSKHRSDLERSLATLPAGLNGYHVISSYGQWFQVRANVSCVANQRNCSQDTQLATGVQTLRSKAPAGPGPTLANITGFALQRPGL